MGCTDRWGDALRNPNGIFCSELLEGHAAVDGLSGPTWLVFGTKGAALGQLLRSRLR
jgi:hypothetical protein